MTELCCRYLSAGWEVASAKDLDDIYENELGAEELQRVAKLELFDEFEEWHMISQHYTYVRLTPCLRVCPPSAPSHCRAGS